MHINTIFPYAFPLPSRSFLSSVRATNPYSFLPHLITLIKSCSSPVGNNELKTRPVDISLNKLQNNRNV